MEYLACLFACQFPECFSHFSPCHSDAFVSMLPGNKQRRRVEVGQHSVLALLSAESLPNRVEASLLLIPGPSDPRQPCRAGRSALFIGVQCEQAPDHGNVSALGHRPCASDCGESLISICCVPVIFPFNPSLACPHL